MSPAFWHHVWSQGFSALWQPEVMLVTLLAALGYFLLTQVFGRHRPAQERASARQQVLFYFMLLVMFFTFGSPVDWLSDNAYFSVHSVEHVVAALVMAPLFIIGLPQWAIRAFFSWRPLAWLWRRLTRPWLALVIWAVVLSVWHVTTLYDLTLVNAAVHLLEHTSMFIAGLIFFWPILSPLEEMPRLHDLAQIAYLLVGNVVCWPLFYALSLTPGRAFYPLYVHVYQEWHVANPAAFAFHDQQAGGMLMMASMLVVLGIAIAAAYFRWRLSDTEDACEANDAEA